MGLLASDRAAEVAVALDQAGSPLTLSAIALATSAPPSSLQRALEPLIEGLVVERRDHTYVLDRSASATWPFLDLAYILLPPDRVLAVGVAANPAVEFAGTDDEGLVLVLSWAAFPADEVRLNRLLGRLEGRISLQPERYDSDELRRRLLDEPELRDRALRLRVLKGSVDRSFPDRRQRGDPSARRLGTLHPSIHRPSRRAIADLARRHRLRRLLVFGSSVREDLRPDSDVDVLVEHRSETERDLDEIVSLRDDLERLFGRHVDVVEAAVMRPLVRQRAEREGVLLHG